MLRLDTVARGRVLEGLVEAGVIRLGEGRPCDVACSTCGKAGVRLVKEGEAVRRG